MKIVELGHYYHLYVNYHVAADAVKNLIPHSLELDLFEGRPIVSWVASTFQDVKIWGLPWKVREQAYLLTLRTYVKQRKEKGWIKGYFTLESWISGFKIKRLNYWLGLGNEESLGIERSVYFEPHEKSSRGIFEYQWKTKGSNTPEILRLRTLGPPQPIMAGYLESFTSEKQYRFISHHEKVSVYFEERAPWVMWELDESVLPKSWPSYKLSNQKWEKPESTFVVKGSKVSVRKV